MSMEDSVEHPRAVEDSAEFLRALEGRRKEFLRAVKDSAELRAIEDNAEHLRARVEKLNKDDLQAMSRHGRAMEDNSRKEFLRASNTWAPYIAIIVTIVIAVGSAAWSISGGLAQLGAKIDAVEAKVDANADAIRDVRDAVEANSQAIAASNTEIGRLGGRLDEHRGIHVEHERRHELAAGQNR